MNRSSIARKRHTAVSSAASEIKLKFACPHFAIIHFDRKIIQYAYGVTEDRLAIVLSSPNNINKQFLASPVMHEGTGADQARVLLQCVDDWNLKKSVIGQVFDTTASNTGHIRGSATRLEAILQRPIMWLACLHHTGELHMKWAYIACRGQEYVK